MPRRSTEYDPIAELVKEMKHYEVIDLEEEWGHLKCPRSDCEGEFKVIRKEFKESRRQVGRSCPYCFRVSAVPGSKISKETVKGQD